MLTEPKFQKLLENLKVYHKKYLNGTFTELDESGTRIMINTFLSDVLGFTALEEIRTEYMIKGTYADYVIQCNGKRHFLVEVKAFSLKLNDNHLRQAVNYGANEGIDWALLTNGKDFDFYKIIFEKPIRHQKVFSLNLSDSQSIKAASELLQFLSRDAVNKNGLEVLWNKALALTPSSLSKTILSPEVVTIVRKLVNKEYDTKFTEDQIQDGIFKIICEKVDLSNFKMPKLIKKVKEKPDLKPTLNVIEPVSVPVSNTTVSNQ